MSSSTAGGVGREDLATIFKLAVVGLVVAATVVAGWFNRNVQYPDPATWEKGRLISGAYDPPDEKVELYLNQGDGQIFAAQAMDPFVRNPGILNGSTEEQAYRLQRPAYGWLGWLASGGQPEAVAWALVAVTILSAAFLVAATGWASATLGGAAGFGLLMLLAPGVWADLLRCGPEMFGCAVTALGLGLWLGPSQRRGTAVVLFAVACLTRETFLAVPATLAAVELWSRFREDRSRALSVRGALPALFPLLAACGYVVWVLVLKVSMGSWPSGSVDGRLSVVPGAGLVEAMGLWRRDEWLAAGVIAVGAVGGLVFGARGPLRALLLVHLAMAAMLGPAVWTRYLDFGRVLLPLSLISVLAMAAGRVGRLWPATPGAHGAVQGQHLDVLV